MLMYRNHKDAGEMTAQAVASSLPKQPPLKVEMLRGWPVVVQRTPAEEITNP
jgi:hypothetical protein